MIQILVADTDQVNTELFENPDYNFFFAKTGEEAWKRILSDPVDIVLSGLELCKQIRAADLDHYIYCILLTDSTRYADYKFDTDVDAHLIKPFNFNEPMGSIATGVKIIRLKKELGRKNDEIKKNYYQTICMFVNLIASYSADLGSHSRRVGELALDIGERYGDVSVEELELLEPAGLLHDIGMVGLPLESLFKKRTAMNDEEKSSFLSHPGRGQMILNEVDMLKPVADIVRSHHEQFNGKGFPNGLKGKEISTAARIISAASIYDNIIHRGGIPLAEVPEKLHQLKGYQIDPEIVSILFDINIEIIQREKSKKYKEVFLDDIKEGMNLAGDIRMKSGAVILPAGKKLTCQNIEKLKEYYTQSYISGKIYISK